LLAQEARNQTRNLLNDENREVLATGSAEFGWVALDPNGNIIDQDSSPRPSGLPKPELAFSALQEDDLVSATIQGSNGGVRVMSMPMHEAGEVVGVMQYARSLREVQETVNRLVFVLLPLGLGGLGLAAVGGMYMARRAVRPVQEAFDRQRAFIADASHELKTPLTLIRADTEVLQRGLTDPDDRELADDVLTETEHMSAILYNLLTAARLDAGVLDMSVESFNISEVLVEVAERFRALSASKGIRLEAQAPGKLLVHGDRARTGQILAALLDNALRHTPSGGDVVAIAKPRARWAEVAVTDTGPGIAPEHLPHIFDRFYRVPIGRTRESGGAGLGLSIACDLARAQKGDLKAENAKDGGAVFRLTLPKE
jgi:signal transduction histidine kinase